MVILIHIWFHNGRYYNQAPGAENEGSFVINKEQLCFLLIFNDIRVILRSLYMSIRHKKDSWYVWQTLSVLLKHHLPQLCIFLVKWGVVYVYVHTSLHRTKTQKWLRSDFLGFVDRPQSQINSNSFLRNLTDKLARPFQLLESFYVESSSGSS